MEPAAAPPSLQRYFSCVTKLIVDKKGGKKRVGNIQTLAIFAICRCQPSFYGPIMYGCVYFAHSVASV
jgi:hypothetical protein